MKKSLVLIISVVAIIAAATVIISASGISDAIYRHRKDKDNMENSVGKLVDDIKHIDLYKKTVDGLTIYPYNKLMVMINKKLSFQEHFVLPMSSQLLYIENFNSLFPIEKINIVNDECLCAEYFLDNNSEIKHAFVVFERKSIKYNKVTECELWKYYGEIYFAYPNLTSEDFADIHPDSIINISGEGSFTSDTRLGFGFGAAFYDQTFDLEDGFYKMDDPNLEVDSESLCKEEILMLKDGYMIITYYLHNHQSGEVKVKNLTFIKYGEKRPDYPYMALISNGFVPDFANN